MCIYIYIYLKYISMYMCSYILLSLRHVEVDNAAFICCFTARCFQLFLWWGTNLYVYSAVFWLCPPQPYISDRHLYACVYISMLHICQSYMMKGRDGLYRLFVCSRASSMAILYRKLATLNTQLAINMPRYIYIHV